MGVSIALRMRKPSKKEIESYEAKLKRLGPEIMASRGNRVGVPPGFKYKVLWRHSKTGNEHISEHGWANRVHWSESMEKLGWVEVGEVK